MADPRDREDKQVDLSHGDRADFSKGIEIVTTVSLPADWAPPSASLDPPLASEPQSEQTD